MVEIFGRVLLTELVQTDGVDSSMKKARVFVVQLEAVVEYSMPAGRADVAAMFDRKGIMSSSEETHEVDMPDVQRKSSDNSKFPGGSDSLPQGAS